MSVAQGIAKITSLLKQSGLGVPAAGAGAQTLRRVTFVPQAARATFENNEIRTDQQSSGVSFGLKSVTAKLSGLLSPGTYSMLFGSLLRKDFVAGSTTGALTNVTAASTTGAQGTFTRAAGSYLTDGFKVGDVFRWAGWATTGATNNAKNLLIIALTATVMTVTTFDASAIGAKASGDSVTATVVGKKTMAPLTGHSNDYYTFEDWYNDVSRSEVFEDCQPSQIDVGIPGTGNATFACDILGLAREKSGVQVLTTPTAQTTTGVVTAANGIVIVNGVAVSNVTASQLTLSGSLQQGDPVQGSNSPNDLQRGRIKVSGQFTALFSDTTLQDVFDNETVVNLILVSLVNKHDPVSSFVAFNLGAIKITGDAPDDGEKQIVRTYPFTAEINGSGGAALANDKTILSVQDSDA